jgi:hypothetical protein
MAGYQLIPMKLIGIVDVIGNYVDYLPKMPFEIFKQCTEQQRLRSVYSLSIDTDSIAGVDYPRLLICER